MRKLKKGFGKYKCKFPLKFFNFGNVGNFSNKCPYAKHESSDDEEYHNVKKGRKHHQHKKNHRQDKNEEKNNSYK